MSQDNGGGNGNGRAGARSRFPLSAGNWRLIAGLLNLSDRELQVVQGIFDGGTEASIAEELDISVHTIHSHLDRLHKKLHVTSRCALVLRVFEVHLGIEAPATRDVVPSPAGALGHRRTIAAGGSWS